jgi:hypothetical protein
VLNWFDDAKNDVHWKSMLMGIPNLEDLFIREKRWADIGRLYDDPMAMLEREQEIQLMMEKPTRLENISDEQWKIVKEMPLRMFRIRTGRIYAGLLAATREEEARKVALRAQELDKTPGMVNALVSAALEVGQPRSEHIGWLEAALKIDESLNDLLKRAQDALTKQEKQ